MGIEVVRDERDKQLQNPLANVPARPGYRRRWVRTKGYDADGHMNRMQEAGYEPVARKDLDPTVGRDPRAQTTQGADLDATVKRGDLMLMECPEERVRAREQAQAVLTRRRTEGATKDMEEKIAAESRGGRRRKE